VAEGLQGGRDLNGDGDAQDAVLHVLSLRTGATQNSGLSGAVAFSFRTTAGSNGVEGARIAIPVDEGSQGFSDLDGDGNRNGFVLHIFDARRRAATNLRLPVSPLVYGGDGFLSVAVPESAGARDLNGDGDTLDEILHLVDIESGAVANARKAVEQFFDPVGVAFPRSDRVQRRLGDTEDGAIEVEDPRAGGAYTFRVSEARNGNVDLNGDGDTIDFVMHGARLEDRDRDGRFDFADDCIGSSRTCPR
jgi:hypothetical protein